MAETIPFKSDEDPGGSPQEVEQPPKQTAPRADDAMGNRAFTSAEVSEIIRVALHSRGTDGESTVDREEMVAIGKEFGLSAEDLAKAFEEITDTRREEARTHKASVGFRFHAMCYVAINGGLFLINMAADPSYWWFVFPLIGWGMLLALHGIMAKYLPEVPGFLFRAFLGHSKRDKKYEGESRRANFTMPDLYASLAEASGLLQVRDGKLLIEYQIQDSIANIFHSRIKDLRIPVAEIDTVHFKRGTFMSRLTLRGRRMRSFSKIPWNKAGEVSFEFEGAAREAAENLAEELIRQTSGVA